MNILSIQSHVAYGHVGNAAAVFPLQRLGFEVWPLNTVQLSNHPGYGRSAGGALPAARLRAAVDGLAALGVLARCDAVLSGYLGRAATGAAVLAAVAAVKAANPNALYACDPVMGDAAEGLYVAPEVAEAFRTRLIARADILTPNLFELETLTGARVATLDEALAAARRAIALGPRMVLVTSLRHATTAAGEIELLAVTAARAWRLATPLLPCAPQPNGAGDMLAGLFLGFYLRTQDVAKALERAAAAVFAVLAATQRAGTRELQLVAAQDEWLAPRRRFTAQPLEDS